MLLLPLKSLKIISKSILQTWWDYKHFKFVVAKQALCLLLWLFEFMFAVLMFHFTYKNIIIIEYK